MSGNNTSDNNGAEKKYTWTAKRVAAVIGIVLLVGLYVLTFISALIGTESSGRLFRFSLGMTIAVPIIWCIGKLQNKHNMASMDILSSNPEERRKMEEALRKEADAAKESDGKD